MRQHDLLGADFSPNIFYKFYAMVNVDINSKLVLSLQDVLQADCDAVQVADEEQVSSYLELQQQLGQAHKDIRAIVNQPRYILPFLQPGRLVSITSSASGDFPLTASFQKVNFQNCASWCLSDDRDCFQKQFC